MKRIISVLMAVVLSLSFSTATFAKNINQGKLKFNNGEFKILLLADVQDGYPIEASFIQYISEALDETKPQLIIFLGDNIMRADKSDNPKDYWLAYDQLLEPITSRGIPFTFVFGNHDDSTGLAVAEEEILKKYMSYDGCMAYDADPSLHGCATHNLEILSSNGKSTIYNLWMMDSGTYAIDNNGIEYYDCVRNDQIQWYERTSKTLENANGGKIPSLMFQHIVPQEVAQNVMIDLPFHLGKSTKNFHDGTAVTYIPDFTKFTGYIFEPPCPSLDNEGQWDSIVDRGDVRAVFFGHDHTNSYKTTVNGVDAINVPSASYEASASILERGGMLVTLNEDNLNTYKTSMVYASKIALKSNSKICETTGKSKAEYMLAVVGLKFLNVVTDFLRNLIGNTHI